MEASKHAVDPPNAHHVAREGSPSDMDRLERVIEELARRHTLLRAENEALRGKLVRRDARMSELEGRVEHLEAQRDQALERLDELLGDVDQIESGLASLVLTSAMREDEEASAARGGREGTKGRGSATTSSGAR